MRGQSHTKTNTSAGPSTSMQDVDLETYYRRLSRRNDCLERQVSFVTLKHLELASYLTLIAEDYKDIESEEDFGLSDTSSSS
ncbi:hypothetical protein MKW98_006814 [Papaver atlanticum]|uniref:Uncharacterized protein n=1 Tax=Papaver atlanticum TaxID=357466 RepID=A0AAD4TD13_9MAGN|nr:hypothetical protein MKW98_006814 [Papaver atlanticum]